MKYLVFKSVWVSCVLLALLMHPQPLSSQTRRMPAETPALGFKVGVNLSEMEYTDENLYGVSELPQQRVVRSLGGVFVSIPLTKSIGVAPELLYVERGMKTSYEHISGSVIYYEIQSRYVDVRLPMTIGVNLGSHIQPYLSMGVEAGYCLGGIISQTCTDWPVPDAEDVEIPIGKANMNRLHAGWFGGAGLKFFWRYNGQRAQLKLDASYHQGLVDSYSSMEHNDTSLPVNVHAYNANGRRLPKGLEFAVGVVIPFWPDKNDACYTFSRHTRKW